MSVTQLAVVNSCRQSEGQSFTDHHSNDADNHRFGFVASVAFDACCFHPSIAWAFLVTLTDLVVLQGHTFPDAVPVTLEQSNNLNRYSRVYVLLLSQDRKIINTARYLWLHRDYQPWGKDVPMQCPKCGAPQERWSQTAKHGGYEFKCRNPHCHGDKVEEQYTFYVKKPKWLTLLPHGKTRTSGWTRKHLRPTLVEA
ncbi:hypothetical protein J3R82DRAFT_11128 [Butyriboletus roseoflavus]|nr:hypothetical protein J3R82DRAFT_11128 [Butyriboletus roseoflavus]